MLINFPNISVAGSLIATKLPRLLLIFLQCHSAVETNYIFKRHASKPNAVANDFCSRRIENFESLLAVSRRIRLYFIMRQLRSRNRPPARIANQSREIADDENCLVAEV